MATRLTQSMTSGGSTTKFTKSIWVKRTGLTQAYLVDSQDDEVAIQFRDDYKLNVFIWNGSSYSTELVSNQLFRDVNAWYHIVWAVDYTNATQAHRARVYVNGEEITSWATETRPGNTTTTFNTYNSSITHYIGNNAGANKPFYGIMSHVIHVDGAQLAPTEFGETDSTTGEWKIKTSPSVTWGTKGYWILKDGNSVTDASTNSNNWTVATGTLTKTEDNPSNVFATLNTLDKAIIGTQPTLANGNTKWTASGNSSSNCAVRGTIGASSGKYYFETKLLEATQTMVGVHLSDVYPWYDSDGYLGNNSGFYGIYSNGSDNLYAVVAGSNQSTNLGSVTNNDILGCAFDFDNNKYYFSKNGSWLNSGDPTSGSTGTGSFGTLASGLYIPAISNVSYNISSSAVLNFGNGYFGTTAVSSAGTNASGIGIFEYDVPTGYTALSTKGLNL